MRMFILGCLAAGLVFTGGALAQSAGWFIGDDYAYVKGPAGTSDLELHAGADVNVSARHIRLGADDGNFEFENRTGVSRLNSYLMGTPTRTPIRVGGGDAQNVLGLIVDGGLTQTADLQQWRKNGLTMSAIDSKGRLRMNGIALSLAYQRKTLVLRATLPDGSTRTIPFSLRLKILTRR